MAISDFSSTYTGGGGGTESGKAIKDLGGLPQGRPPVYAPPSGSGADTTGATPGTYNIDPLDPGSSYAHAAQESEGWLAGFKNALFGTSAPDSAGQHGGVLGDIPIVGDVTRAASETIANAAGAIGTVGKGALDVAGGALEHVDLGSDTQHAQLQREFDAVPDSADKQAALDQIAKDPGATGHYMAQVVKAHQQELLDSGDVKPNFESGAFHTPGSAAEAVDNIMGLMGLSARLTERTWAEHVAPMDQNGKNRLQMIMAVGDGLYAFNKDKGILGTGALAGDPTQGLNAIEAIVYKKVSNHEWTDSQALDFLSAHNAGYSHSAIANLAGNVALDPQNLVTLGAAGIGKIGLAGGKLMQAVNAARDAAEATQVSIDAARGAMATATGLDKGAKAAEVARLTTQLGEDHALLEKATTMAYKSGEAAGPLGKLARSEGATDVLRAVYKTYEPLQQLHIIKALKVVRGIVDPLGAMSLHNPFRAQMVDLMGETGTKIIVGAYGDANHAGLVHALADATEGAASPLADAFSEHLGTYSANIIRATIARTQRDRAMAAGLGDALAHSDMEAVLAGVGTKVEKSYVEYILREANAHRIHVFDDIAKTNLAERLFDNFGVKSAEDWGQWMADHHLNADQMGMLHAATYGSITKRTLAGVEQARKMGGVVGDLSDKLHRLIPMNRTTLTRQGAEGLIKRASEAKSTDEAVAEIVAAQKQYPELRGFTLDTGGGAAASASRFIKELGYKVESFPMQVTEDELKTLPEDLAAIHNDKTFTLGFAPEDHFKWGLERTNAEGGKFGAIHDVWVDHVAPGLAMGYRPVSAMVETNIAGMPIIGKFGKPLARGADYIDAGIRTMGRAISGTVIAETARQKFIAHAVDQFGHVGINEKVANDIMAALEDAVGRQDIVVRASGLTSKNMWEVAKTVLPKGIREEDFGRRDVMALILNAYQGDLRYVGLTQALSSRIKRVLAFDSNNASVLAEQVYPTLKYRLNTIFQAQEKIEPIVLNAARGVIPARSIRSLSEADKATEVLLQRMAQRSLVSNADQEMAEYASPILHGKDIEQLARGDTRLGQVTKKLGVDWEALRDVKGMKQVNMLRTFRKGLGAEMRKSWEKTNPGEWDKMFLEAQRKAGAGLLDEDEFAVSVMAEQMLGSDVHVGATLEQRLGKIARGFDKVDYKASIVPGEWSSPQTLGQLKPLGLDDLSEMMAFPVMRGGAVTKTQADVRSAIAAGDLKIEDVVAALHRFNADPDYISRVAHAFGFSHTGFWQQAEHDFNLTPERSRELQDMVANAADLRGMTPVDYLSQIMVPTIGEGGTEAVMGHLGKIVDILGPDKTKIGEKADLASLIVPASGEGTEEMFVKQLASIFSDHLDPSAKRALLIAFRPELEARLSDSLDLSVDTVNRLFDSGMQDEFARHILGEINPTHQLGELYDAGLLRTAADFDRIDPGTTLNIIRADGVTVPGPVNKLIGDGLRTAPPAVQRDVLRTLGRYQAQFPGVKIGHVNVVDDMKPFISPGEDPFGIAGATLTSSEGGDVIILNKHYFGDHPSGTSYEDFWKGHAQSVEGERTQTHFTHSTPFGPTDMPRESLPGATFAAGNKPTDTVDHEFAHALDTSLRNRHAALKAAGKGRTKEAVGLNKYIKFMDRFDGSPAHLGLSEYSHVNADEMSAEFLSATFSGDPKAIDAATASARAKFLAGEPVNKAVEIAKGGQLKTLDEFGNWLTDIEMNPMLQHISPDAVLGHLLDAQAWETKAGHEAEMEAALAAARKEAAKVDRKIAAALVPDPDAPAMGVDAAAHKVNGPQTMDQAATEIKKLLGDIGVWKAPPAPLGDAAAAATAKMNAEVIRSTQMFGKWTTNVLADGIRKGENAQHAATLEKIAGIPTHQAVPYNFTEHMIQSNALEAMKGKWDDAHRLQYYARQRSMLERSINHPMFGIYPASYMWGKMLPELTRFIAKEPFGLRTGAAAYTYTDVQRDIALQREFDPTLDKKINDLGHSSAMFALGYMMPSWPWEFSAGAPGWSREFAQEGLDMQSRVEAGGTVKTPAGGNGINLPQIATKATDVMNPVKALDRTIMSPVKEVTNPQPEPTTSATYGQPVAAGDLGNPLTDALSSLRALLGG